MQDWEVGKIKEAIDKLKKEEIREFMIVYSILEEKYHGYLQALPQRTQVWYQEVDSDALKELKNQYGWDKLYVNKKTFFVAQRPYLGIDGCLAILHDAYDDVKIATDLVETKHKLVIKATVTAGNLGASAYVDVPFDVDYKTKKIKEDPQGSPLYVNLEIPTSTAIRKAIVLMGIGRFPTEATDFGDHAMVKEFRKFKASQ